VPWDLLLAKPGRAGQALRSRATRLKIPQPLEDASTSPTATALIGLLQRLDGNPDAVLVAGHNPGLQELIFDLVAPENENKLFDKVAEKYPTATFAVLELAIDRWADCQPGCGKLVHLARPRDLDPELGPEKVR
jgi:phosphohistidine phosphatase